MERTTTTAPPNEPVIRGPVSGRMLVSFSLPAPDGRPVRSDAYRQRVNLVVVFHHGGECSACRTLLRALAARAADIASVEAVVLAIGPDDPTGAGRLAAELGKPIVVLSDAAGAIAARQGLAVPAIAVTDRFGELWAAWEGGDAHRLPDPTEVLDWLEFIEVQCPECAPPEPWGDADA